MELPMGCVRMKFVKNHFIKRWFKRFCTIVLITLIVFCYFKLNFINNTVSRGRGINQLLNLTDFHYIISNDVCQSEDIFLLIIIHSAPNHFPHRQLIRDTWGKPDTITDKNIKVVFLLASAPHLQSDIQQESDQHKDLVQGNFIDAYRNLTYKHSMGLKWASENCGHAEYLMKMDDDIFVDMFQWVEYIAKNLNSSVLEKNIACFLQTGMPVVRDPVSKWYVSKLEYPSDVFENYCSGWAYVTSITAAYDLFESLQSLNFFWVDDVLVTGTAARTSNISHIRINHLFDLESGGLMDWSSTDASARWTKMFAPTWGDLQLSRVAYRKSLQCWVTGCKCCYSRKTTTLSTKATTTRKGIAKLLSL